MTKPGLLIFPTDNRPVLTIPADHDHDTITAAIGEIDSWLDYETQSGRLDDRTIEGFVIALEVLRDVQFAYGELAEKEERREKGGKP